MPTRQDIVSDLCRQVSRLIGTTNAVLERYSRSMEELDSIRLSLEELRELLSDYFDESSRYADKIADRLARLERLAILEKTHANRFETLDIKKDITDDLHRDSLRRELIQQTKNLAIAQEKAARHGFDIPTRLVNEIETYNERIEIIRTELDKLTPPRRVSSIG